MVHHSGWLAYTSYLRGSLGLSTGPGGEICDLNPYFIVAVLHIIGSSALGLGGVFHSLLGPESLDNNLPSLFAITFKDRFKVSSILGVHLISLGIASGLLVLLGKYSGLYDTFASGGGDTRLVTNITRSYYVLFSYLVKPPFGNQGSIISINNLEDFLGGQYLLSYLLTLGGLWHIVSKPVPAFVRSYVYTWATHYPL